RNRADSVFFKQREFRTDINSAKRGGKRVRELLTDLRNFEELRRGGLKCRRGRTEAGQERRGQLRTQSRHEREREMVIRVGHRSNGRENVESRRVLPYPIPRWR